MMRLLAGLIALLLPGLVTAQTVVTSPAPDKVALTVYRDPEGEEMDLDWLEGFALVSETRRVTLPAGEVELRFEGVTEGIIPQSAIVTGLGDALIEKNRDAMLLSPGHLLDAHLGQRVHLRRTSVATGKVTEEDAIVRAAENGVVIQTSAGIESLRCTGLAETLRTDRVPATLSAKPTLSTRLRLSRPVEAEVQLTYLSNNFDWRAHYVATLAPDGKTLSLFAWLTLANGDTTTLANADTYAIAGRLNREAVEIDEPDASAINLSCWPSGKTSDFISPQDFKLGAGAAASGIVVTGTRIASVAPPEPEMDDSKSLNPLPSVGAQLEALGDLKLYRIPIPVTVAANSQKQVALLQQPRAEFQLVHRLQTSVGRRSSAPKAMPRVLVAQNKKEKGLGLPLPAGSFTLYTKRGSDSFLLGEGKMIDRAEGEKVEVIIDPAPGVRVFQRQVERKGKWRTATIDITNDGETPVDAEVLFPAGTNVSHPSERLHRRDGQPLWQVPVPANGVRTLRYRWKDNGASDEDEEDGDEEA